MSETWSFLCIAAVLLQSHESLQELTGSGIMTSSMAEQGAPTRQKTSRLLSRLRCGLQTHLLCTAGLSCRPSSSSESTSELPRRQTNSSITSQSEVVSSDRKRLRSCNRISSSEDGNICADSGVGRSLETLDSASHVTSGCVTSGPTYSSPATRSTYDVIGRRRKRRSTRLPTVDELDQPETEIVTWSRDHVTRNNVIESPATTTCRRKKIPDRSGQLYSCCNHFYGKRFCCDLCLFY